MNLWQRLFSRKASVGQQALVMNQVGRAQGTTKNYESFAKEGYQSNVIAFQAISKVSRACSGIKWQLYQKKQGGKSIEILEHPLLTLIDRPNPNQGQSAFMESMIAYFLISGNSYIEKVSPTPKAPPMELWPLRPDKMRVIPGINGVPQAFELKSLTAEVIFPVNQVNGQSNVLHLKTFHPTDNWYGMSPIEAAMYPIDQHNESGKWNLALLQNQGTPSGALIIKENESNPMGSLPEPQFKNLQEQIRSQIAGSRNAGRVMLLEGGMDWKQMGFSAQDIAWLEGKNTSARDICLAFGVPPIMLNIPGDSTFNNYREARTSLYEETVLPLMDFIKGEFNRSITPSFGPGIYLEYDKDSIPALDLKRAEKFTQYSSAGFLTVNEKREALGYDPIEGGELLLVNSGQVDLASLGAEEVSDEDSEDPKPDDEAIDQDAQEEEGSDENPQDTETDADAPKKNSFHTHESKQVNAITQRQKFGVWKQVNEIRARMSHAMAEDLKEDFKDQAAKLESAMSSSDAQTAEMRALSVLSDSAQMEKTIQKHIRRAMIAFGEPIFEGSKQFGPEYGVKSSVRFNQFVDIYIKKHAAQSVSQIEGTSIKSARRIIKNIIADSNAAEMGYSSSDVAHQLRQEFVSLSTSRSKMIARTEIGSASTQGALEAAKTLEIPDLEKEWVSVNDDRTRDDPSVADHASMNGVRVSINDKFTVPPDASMTGPGDSSAPPEQVIQCRCALVFARAGKTMIPDYGVK